MAARSEKAEGAAQECFRTNSTEGGAGMKDKIIGFSLVMILIGVGLFPGDSMSAPAKKFLIAIGQEPTSIDPSLVYVGADYVSVENWAESLIYRDPNGDLGPGLASSWKVSPDGKIAEFTLRKGVKFHSGDLLTVKDVLFSFERGLAKNSSTRTRLRLMERFEVIDDYSFRVHFKAPDVTFVPNRGGPMIVSKSYYDRVGEEKFMKEPVGTASYKFVRYVPGEYIDIERFEDYWGEKPSLKEARFVFVPEDTTRLAKLKTGEVDFIASCPYPSVNDVEKTSGLKVVRFPANHPTPIIVFSTRNPKVPWHDRRVRLAMAHAINYDAIIHNVLLGIPNRWAYLAPYELGYDPDLKPYPYDPKKSKELLTEAGYPKGFDLKLYYLMTGRPPMIRETVEAMASYFEAVGIRTRLIGEEVGAYNARRRAAVTRESEFVGLSAAGNVAGGIEPTWFLDILLSSDGGFSVYSNPEFDKVIAEARITVDESKRRELIMKAVRIAHDEAAVIPIYNTVSVYAMKRNVDFKPTQGYPFDVVFVKDITVR
jgi:peptide/nickel transport system substrate-binding protein